MEEAFDLRLPSGRLHAHAAGPADGPLVLCVHGLSANGLGFAAFGERLAARGLRVVAPDLRGRGASDVTAPGTYGLNAHASDVLDVATELGAERFDVIGWSMGALIAMVLAGRSPDRLRSVVLLDHAGRMDATALEAIEAGLARLQAVVPAPETYVDAIRAASPIERWDARWDAFYRHELAQREDGSWSPRTDLAACREDLEETTAHDWPALWAALTMPTLLVRSARPLNGGFIVPEAERDALVARAPGATAVDVDSNHFDVMTDAAALGAVEELLTTRP